MEITTREVQIYIAKLEQRVMIPVCVKKLLGSPQFVSVKGSAKLECSPLGLLLGTRFAHTAPMAIDYYNLVRRSTGFMALAANMGNLCGMIFCPIVHFQSLRETHIRDFAPELLQDFCSVKEYLQTVRFK